MQCSEWFVKPVMGARRLLYVTLGDFCSLRLNLKEAEGALDEAVVTIIAETDIS